ncbi:MAG: inositol monophosphatase family protein [Eubacterium sp.]|nr:inositol monophosphatase family protein [Eubacterium sp.]
MKEYELSTGQNQRMGDSVKRTSNYSEQGLFRKEVLSFTQEKANAFSLLFVPPAEGGGMEISVKINREKARNAFDEYVSHYNAQDEKVKLKIEHTYRVCELCEEIAKNSGFTEEETELAWLSGLLHDVGRFEQLRQYGTFHDAQSIDHAQFGADILFKEGKISEFIDDFSENDLLEKVVRTHSAYRLPENFTDRECKFANLLRDADKVDILKVNVIVPLEEIYDVTAEELRNCAVTDVVMEEFLRGHTILRSLKKAPVDHVVGHISLVYELVYPISLQLAVEQGYLHQIMQFQSNLDKTMVQFEKIRQKMQSYIREKLMEKELINNMIAVIRECGTIMLQADRSGTFIEQKEGHANFVTVYDKKVQMFLMERLLALVPEAVFVGEEEETHASIDKGFAFIVDPIDGTTNFMKDYHTSAISIGLLKNGNPYIGMIYNPYLDEIFYAQKGCGAFLNGKEIHVSNEPLSNGIVLFGTSPYYEELSKISFDLAYDYFKKALDVRRSGSAALDLCSIAAGRAELYFECKLSPWDYAAGCLIVVEAGGKVTQLDGSPLVFDTGCSVLATNGK